MKRLNDALFPELRKPIEHAGDRTPILTVDETSGAPILEMGGAGAEEFRPEYIGASLSSRRLLLSFGACFLALIGLAARAAQLDLVRGERYRQQAEGNRLRIVSIPSERGVVHDRHGRLLARNIPDFTLTMTPADLPKEERARMGLIVRVAEIVESTPVDIEKILQRYRPAFATPVPIKEHLAYEKALLLDVESGSMPGVALNVGTKREYLLNAPNREEPVLSMSHVIGYEGRISEGEYGGLRSSGYQPSDRIGKTGIEASYERELRGTYGKKQIEVDAFGREQSVLAEDDPVSGKDVTLSIDMELQAHAERALRKSAALNGRGRGAVVAMDPKTGEILAMVSWPAYDANHFARGISLEDYAKLVESGDQPLYPRAIAGLYPPGSTVKPVVAAAALAEGIITPQTSLISSGGIRVGQWFFPDWKRGGHGTTNVIRAIAESVNTFFYAIGGGWEHLEGLGIGRLAEWYRRFGLGAPLGLDLPGERAGFVPNDAWKEAVKKEAWFIGDTYNISIGQGGLLVTPLQIAAWTAVFANGGDLVRPRAVKSLRSNDAVLNLQPDIARRAVVPPDIVETVRRGMRQTVLTGSAQSLKSSPWDMAGKTGTAQWRKGEPNHAWFTGFAPYDDPKIVVTALIEAGGEGSRVAAPVARDIMEAWLRLQDVRPSRAYAASATGTDAAFWGD